MTFKPLKSPVTGKIRPDQPSDYTAATATNRSLFIDLKFVKFGTRDPLQGAAIVITLLFTLLSLGCIFLGIWQPDWALEALKWLGSPLMLALGVALGRSSQANDKDRD